MGLTSQAEALRGRVRGVYYGWWMVAVSGFIMVIATVPLFHAMSLWAVALESQFGWSRTQLGLAFTSSNTILVDRDAAGHGWALSKAEEEDSPIEGVDLLSVVVHEFGHLLGFDHNVLGTHQPRMGVRQLPKLLPGDTNLDGTVDVADWLTFASNYGKHDLDWAGGDFTGDGKVQFDDFLQLASNFVDLNEGNSPVEALFANSGDDNDWWRD